MHPTGIEPTICLFLFVIYFAWYLVCRSESCVAIISFSILLSDHTRQSYESFLFTNTVCRYCQYIVRALFFSPSFKDTANRASVCCMLSSVFWQYFHLFGFIRLQLLSFFNCWIWTWLIACVDLNNTRCYPKIRGIQTARQNQLSHALPPLDVARSMLCESMCQLLSNWEDVLISSGRFVRLCFSDPAFFFFYNWYDGF